MERAPVFSIITVNFNQSGYTEKFINSVDQLDFKDFELIVVDNGSKIDSCMHLQDQYPWVIFIESQKNLGFAGGNNLGVVEARGKYLFFLNNDTLLPSDLLSKFLPFLEAHPNLGMVSPKVIFPNGNIQYGGAIDISPWTGRGERLGLEKKDLGQYDGIYLTDLCHGAAMIVPKSIIDKVGKMPEVYFLYYEEHDWTHMIKRAGYEIYYFGQTHVIHDESVSIGKQSPLKTYYLFRNRILFMRRNYTLFQNIVFYLFFISLVLPKSLFSFLVKQEKENLNAMCKGIAWHFKKSISHGI
jgi:GT2 family glycosyltransferase